MTLPDIKPAPDTGRRARHDWKPYDPAWLAALAREQHPDLPWLADGAGAARVRQPHAALRRLVEVDDVAVPQADKGRQNQQQQDGKHPPELSAPAPRTFVRRV